MLISMICGYYYILIYSVAQKELWLVAPSTKSCCNTTMWINEKRLRYQSTQKLGLPKSRVADMHAIRNDSQSSTQFPSPLHEIRTVILSGIRSHAPQSNMYENVPKCIWSFVANRCFVQYKSTNKHCSNIRRFISTASSPVSRDVGIILQCLWMHRISLIHQPPPSPQLHNIYIYMYTNSRAQQSLNAILWNFSSLSANAY